MPPAMGLTYRVVVQSVLHPNHPLQSVREFAEIRGVGAEVYLTLAADFG